MQSETHQSRHYRFGAFEIDLLDGELRRQGLKVKLNEKPFQVLALLLEHAGHLVSRESLRQRLWAADTYVDFDANLNTALSTLRHALGDPSDNPVFIETIPRQGYRFIAPVTPIVEAGGGLHTDPTRNMEEGILDAAARDQRKHIRTLVPILILVMLGCGFGWLVYARWLRRPIGSANRDHKLTILVMPFENLSGDSAQDYLSDGLTEEMITSLGQVSPRKLSVIARSTAIRYKHTQETLEQVAQENHVDYVVEGGVQRQGDRVRISAQLFKSGEQGSLWTEAYDQHAGDLLLIQRDVADRITNSLFLEVLPSPVRRETAENRPDPEAYDDYLKGLFALNKRTQEDLRRSIVYFRQAIVEDPGFAGAYAALASAYNVAAGWGFLRPGEAYSNAETAVRKALALDNTLADAHSAYAEILHEYHWDWAGSEREYQQALELNPSSAAGHKLYAEYLTHAGRYTEALGEIRKAQELDPASLITNAFVCFVYYHAREYDKAIRECSKTVALDSSFVPAHYWRGTSYVFAGRYEEALGDFRKASELSEGATYFQTWTALAYALEGKKDEARKILEKLRRRPRDVYVSAYGLADIYISLGDREQAISMLDKACQERSADLVFLATAQEFDVLHGDPEFQQMIARLDFPNSAIADAKASKPWTRP